MSIPIKTVAPSHALTAPFNDGGNASNMTLRDYMATTAMLAFITSPHPDAARAFSNPAAAAEWAVEQADKLIAELAKK